MGTMQATRQKVIGWRWSQFSGTIGGRVALVLVLAAAAIAGCTGGGTTGTQPPGGTAPAESSGGTAPSTGPASQPAGGSAADACAVLTPAEIEAELGVPMKEGVLDEFGGGSAADCTWESEDPTKGASVLVTIEPFDATTWELYFKLGTEDLPTVQLPGIGDEAVLVGGTILGGLVAVHKGSTLAEIQVLGVFLDQDVVEAAREPLARIVASRI